MPDYISPSQYKMFLRCGIQYEFRYLKNMVRPPGVSMIVGGGVHKGAAANYNEFLETERYLPIEAVESITSEEVHTQLTHGEIALSEDERKTGIKRVKAKAVDSSVKMSRAYYETVGIHTLPDLVEKKLEVEWQGIKLLGIVDLLARDKSLHDLKTTSKTPSVDIAHNDDQLSFYGIILQASAIPFSDMALDYVIDLDKKRCDLSYFSEPSGRYVSVQTFQTKRTPKQLKVFGERILKIKELIDKEIFIPCPRDSWWCNSRWCGWWDLCKWKLA